jgi:hypothetical protein
MTYEGDLLLPILTEEIKSRVDQFTSLSADDESKLLSLTTD